jgi:hypothetical protein
MRNNILRRGVICGALGIIAALAIWGTGEDFSVPELVFIAAAFAVASFIPMTVWSYVASNILGKKQ